MTDLLPQYKNGLFASFEQCQMLLSQLLEPWKHYPGTITVAGIQRGGLPLAVWASHILEADQFCVFDPKTTNTMFMYDPTNELIIVDDIIDSEQTVRDVAARIKAWRDKYRIVSSDGEVCGSVQFLAPFKRYNQLTYNVNPDVEVAASYRINDDSWLYFEWEEPK